MINKTIFSIVFVLTVGLMNAAEASRYDEDKENLPPNRFSTPEKPIVNQPLSVPESMRRTIYSDFEFFCCHLFLQAFPNFQEPKEGERVFSIGDYFYYQGGQIALNTLNPEDYSHWRWAFKKMLKVEDSFFNPSRFWTTLWEDFFKNSIESVNSHAKLSH
ncbi:MAG: hypothetical protein GY915_04895 [bacterium]|nr:hypothetical protein [bacterium]